MGSRYYSSAQDKPPFPSLPFPSLPFPSLPFPSLPFPLPFPFPPFPFPFLSFGFISFPFLLFPFLSFAFLVKQSWPCTCLPHNGTGFYMCTQQGQYNDCQRPLLAVLLHQLLPAVTVTPWWCSVTCQSSSSGRCQECQDQSLCNTVALTTLSCCCCRSPAAGGHWHRRCAGLSGHAAHWLGYQVRSFFSPVCILGWHGQPLCTFTSPCFCIYPGESWKH